MNDLDINSISSNDIINNDLEVNSNDTNETYDYVTEISDNNSNEISNENTNEISNENTNEISNEFLDELLDENTNEISNEILDENTNEISNEILDENTDKNMVECIICYNYILNQSVKKLICGCDCIFHYECLLKWFEERNTCPLCRTVIYNNLQNNRNNIQEFQEIYRLQNLQERQFRNAVNEVMRNVRVHENGRIVIINEFAYCRYIIIFLISIFIILIILHETNTE